MPSFPQARPSTTRLRRGSQDGSILLTLLLMVALMGIFALMVAVPIKFEIQREREQEMIHRGVQYSRAIRAYYKKYGRYPTRLEDLDNTSNLRYLRKHYKDPLTGKDFKLLHYGDPGVSLSGGFGSTPIAGANTVGQLNGTSSGNSAFGGTSSSFSQPSSFGGNSNSAFGGGSSFGGGNSSLGGNSNNSAFGGNSSSGFGASSNSQTTSSTPAQQGTNAPAGSDASQTVSATGPAAADAASSTQQVFGGGPIVGVASISKDNTIREFNKKKKYNEWQFVYDPTTDRGGLILTPYQPALQVANQPLNGQTGNNNTNSSPFGQPTGFGSSNPTGFGNNNPGLNSGPAAPTQPANPQPPQ